MKKILLLSVLFLGLQTMAQKTVYIYNFSSTNFDIGDIGTKKQTASHPIFLSKPSGGLISIPPGATYILEASPASTNRFPFYSPTSSPNIDNWSRQLVSGGAWSNPLPSSLVANIYGATQIIEHVKTQVGPSGALGGGTLFPVSPDYFDSYTYGSLGGTVSLNVIDPVSGAAVPDGETYIVITD
ncbi:MULTISPECIES: hypothetical protein [Bizionia]|uniref:T9SS C-terminal target domain-containing protein n=1 Tax=Bizionia algoritergicola TaxID=291187 RepID=A0A5D0R2R0_9FLAO|nr:MULTISPECIES: hypothetical protein [Bizionia]TYB74834.1 hypothetical protein ES675_01480 [Bizionia algoritergicola]